MERGSVDADPPSAGRCFPFCPAPRDGDIRGDSAWMSPDPPAPRAAGASSGGGREAETPSAPGQRGEQSILNTGGGVDGRIINRQ